MINFILLSIQLNLFTEVKNCIVMYLIKHLLTQSAAFRNINAFILVKNCTNAMCVINHFLHIATSRNTTRSYW